MIHKTTKLIALSSLLVLGVTACDKGGDDKADTKAEDKKADDNKADDKAETKKEAEAPPAEAPAPTGPQPSNDKEFLGLELQPQGDWKPEWDPDAKVAKWSHEDHFSGIVIRVVSDKHDELRGRERVDFRTRKAHQGREGATPQRKEPHGSGRRPRQCGPRTPRVPNFHEFRRQRGVAPSRPVPAPPRSHPLRRVSRSSDLVGLAASRRHDQPAAREASGEAQPAIELASANPVMSE